MNLSFIAKKKSCKAIQIIMLYIQSGLAKKHLCSFEMLIHNEFT